MTSKDLIKEIEAIGWNIDRIKGSHPIFKHPTRWETLVIPHPKKDLGVGWVASIRKKAVL